ncbi:MAG: hypothetical protein J6P21_00350 [Clostridia bacterium]|nr:hypothetical protein [Clostridia bacterium]
MSFVLWRYSLCRKFKNKKFMSALLATTAFLGGKTAPQAAAAGNTTLKSVEYNKSVRNKSLIAFGTCVLMLPVSIWGINKAADYLEKKEAERKESERKKEQEIEREKHREFFSNLGKKLGKNLFDHYSKKFDEELKEQRVKKFAEEREMKEKQASESKQKKYQDNYNKFVKSKFEEAFKNSNHKSLHDLLNRVFQNEWDVVCKKVTFVRRPLAKWENGSYMDISYQNGVVKKCDVHAIPNPKEPKEKQLLDKMINEKAFEERMYTELEGWGSYLSNLTHGLYNSFKLMFEQKWVDEELKAFEVKDNSIGYSLSGKQVTDKIEFLKDNDKKILRFTISNSALYNTDVDLTFDLDVSEYLS